MSWPWSQLGLPGPSELSQVRRAYAQRLKTTHPEEDPEGFQRLHAAYQQASRIARQEARQRRAGPTPQPEPRPEGHRASSVGPEKEGPEKEEIDIEGWIQSGEQDPRRRKEEKPGPDFDFDELLKGAPPSRPSDQGPEKEEIDIEAWIQSGEQDPRRRKEEGPGPDFDFDELLKGAPPSRPSGQGPEKEEGPGPDLDFDELLEGGPPPQRPPEPEKGRDFDFDRLFAEGEAERAEARRRRGEERRRAQEQERQRRQERRRADEAERRSRSRQQQDRWQDTEIVLHTIEMLYSSRAGREVWGRFFQSPLFRQTRDSLDLLFGLEDFVSDHPDLPREIRVVLFQAFSFEKGEVRPEQNTLYRMLLPSWKAKQKERRRYRWSQIGCGLGSVVLIVLIVSIFLSSYLPVYLLIGGLALFGLDRGWLRCQPKILGQEKRPDRILFWLLSLSIFAVLCRVMGLGLTIPLYLLGLGGALWAIQKAARLVLRRKGGAVPPKQERRTVLFAVLCLGVLILLLPGIMQGLREDQPVTDPREQVCQYMEEDLGRQFRHFYEEDAPSSRLGNVFAPADEPERMFLAGPDGARDLEAGRRGYTTNYPEMMVLWALEDFAKEHGIPTVDVTDRLQGLEDWDTTGTFLLALPFYGAGDIIVQAGELLEELSQEGWYQVRTPEIEVVLCSSQMKEGRLILSRWSPADGPFDAAAVRQLYEESFAHAYCAQLLQEQELDRDFVHGGVEIYDLTDEGFAELSGETCCKLYGLDSAGQVAMEYYVGVDSGAVTDIYCVPGGFWALGGREEQLRLHSVEIRSDRTGILSIHCPR